MPQRETPADIKGKDRKKLFTAVLFQFKDQEDNMLVECKYSHFKIKLHRVTGTTGFRFPGDLTRQRYPGGLCLLWTRGWGQIFNDLHKVQREDTDRCADLSLSPVLSHKRLQLDHIPLRERQLVTVLPLKIEPRHASWTTLGEIKTFQTSGLFISVVCKGYSKQFMI